MKSKKITLCQIDLQMCIDYQLEQAMDYNYKKKQFFDKGRGYVNVLIKLQGMLFLIPLRSYMPKKYQLKYKLRDSEKIGFVEGLDFGKMLILEDERYIIKQNFRLRKQEDYHKIIDHDVYIINKLIKHIISFNEAIASDDRNKLTDPMRFKFTTFINYIDRLKVITEDDYIY